MVAAIEREVREFESSQSRSASPLGSPLLTAAPYVIYVVISLDKR